VNGDGDGDGDGEKGEVMRCSSCFDDGDGDSGFGELRTSKWMTPVVLSNRYRPGLLGVVLLRDDVDDDESINRLSVVTGETDGLAFVLNKLREVTDSPVRLASRSFSARLFWHSQSALYATYSGQLSLYM